MARNRLHTHLLVSAVASCENCAWNINAQNAQALGARHFDNKGHRVRVTLTTEIVYGRLSGKARGGEKQEGLF